MGYKRKLYGAILGDLIGKPYEFPAKGGPVEVEDPYGKETSFTDDTLMTLATASFLLDDHNTIEEAYKEVGRKYDGDYYGKGFKQWLQTPLGTGLPSYGNGCIMRISPYMYLDGDIRLPLIMDSVMCSHRNEISIRSAIKLYDAYCGADFEVYEVEPFKKFEVKADKTVDFCVNLFYQSPGISTFDLILKAVSCGGDTDTNASICGELSNYFLKDIDDRQAEYVEWHLDDYLLDILKRFNEKFD